jgi:hypothetical protein
LEQLAGVYFFLGFMLEEVEEELALDLLELVEDQMGEM